MRIQSWTSVAVAALGSLLLSACGDDRSTKTDISSQPTAENNPAIEFILTLPEPLSEDTQFSYQTVDGTAKAGEDYQETSEGVVVAQGATSLTISIPLLNDEKYECDETFSLKIIRDESVLIGEATIINDQDPGPQLSFQQSQIEVLENAQQVQVGLSLAAASCKDATIQFSSQGIADQTSDFTLPDSIVIAAGETSATFSISINDDQLAEDGEKAVITASSADEVTVTGQQLDLKIIPVLKKLDASPYTICAQTEDGAAKCWGSGSSYNFATVNDDDYVGDIDADMGENLKISQLGDLDLLDIQTSEYFSCGLFGDQTVRCWGSNASGQLGLGMPDSGTTQYIGDDPAELGNQLQPVLFGSQRYAVQMSTGNAHSCAVLDNGRIKCWGNNSDGQLGYGDTLSRGDSPATTGDNLPEVNLGTDDQDNPLLAKYVAAGWDSTCAILQNDQLKCWGDGTANGLGNASQQNIGDQSEEMSDELFYVDLGAGRTVNEVFVYYRHNCAILDNQKLKCWGSNSSGQIGQGSSKRYFGMEEDFSERFCDADPDRLIVSTSDISDGSEPCILGGRLLNISVENEQGQLEVLKNHQVCHTESAYKDIFATRINTASPQCGGSGLQIVAGSDNNRDQLIDSAMGDMLPYVDFANESPVIDVDLGDGHTCALLADGTHKCWGYNGDGQAGQDTEENWGDDPEETPAILPSINLGSGLTAIDVAASYDYSCALLNNNKIKCWGYSDYGPLAGTALYDMDIGDGKDEDNNPIKEMGDTLQFISLF